MTRPATAVGPTIGQRWRTGRWVVLALLVIVVIAAVGTYLTAPRPGEPMDPQSTSPDGARALVSLLRDRGVDVVEARSVADVERAARDDTLIVFAQTSRLTDDDQLRRLAELPGDRLLVEPVSRAREALAPGLRTDGLSSFAVSPDCDLREANRAGDAQLGLAESYRAADPDVDVTRCYDGALVRYTDAGRTITVVGTSAFMTNDALLGQGNAALAMNLAGAAARVIWFTPQERDGAGGDASLADLIPDQVSWIVLQLILAVVLLAIWQGRRLGPLVAESLPVVIRASETVEGRGRLYRSRRARDRAADALRTGTLARLLPRLGLSATAQPGAVTQAVAARIGADPSVVGHVLYGPAPATDADLVTIARQLDDIERQVAHS
ncbi:DUF4350 domain-containing protein [Mycolicibacterium litorale]|uniref:Membrane protein n=1 Tax=Mycolicibacterium litorale TaxID=758802 RepID=A0AAD1MWT3_9MYCO|nr:DUF4350 domain-containing protein [Mycolicibacterium litorale]MCV7417902.1 DUF4350 domain-containing protein [Mycolicibacterium litorale]TDY06710.1 uncharacterized protein DUF4350 [Mycolicibacterium litorale]BBY19138.1 membrane protein [Mycolicibacterium litorale]